MLTHNEYDFINGLKMVLSKFKKKFHILILGSFCIRGNPGIITVCRIFFQGLTVTGFLITRKEKNATTWAGVFIIFVIVDKLVFGYFFRFSSIFNSHSCIRNISIDSARG